MPSRSLTTKQFGGLNKAVDAVQLGEVGVVNGKNFLVDAKGPHAAFGTNLISYSRITNGQTAATFAVAGETFIFTNEGVLSYDDVAQEYFPVYTFTVPLTDPFPWSRAIVGGIHYFTKNAAGSVFAYNPTLGTWSIVSGPSTPPAPYFVAEVFGRLAVLSDGVLQWSAISNGTDLVANVTTGAGAQATNVVGSGTPLGLFSVSDGLLTFTTSGIMKSEFTGTAVVFRHYELDHESPLPISASAIVSIDNKTVAFLAVTGLYISSGGKPEPWLPLVSEFFKRDIFPFTNPAINGLIRMAYNEERQWLLISVATLQVPFEFSIAYVVYTPLEKMGVFNENHYIFGEFNVTAGISTGKNFSHICDGDLVHKFVVQPQREVQLTDLAEHYYRHTPITYPSRIQSGVHHAPSMFRFGSVDRTQFGNDTALYHQTTLNVASHNIQSIDSFVDIGPYAITTDISGEFVNEFFQAYLVTDNTVPVEESEDWNLLAGEEDWNVDEGEEDWGFSVFSTENYTLDVVGTWDGETQFYDQIETGVLVDGAGKGSLFAFDVSGIYTILRLKALDIGQSFHLKLVKLDGILGGKL